MRRHRSQGPAPSGPPARRGRCGPALPDPSGRRAIDVEEAERVYHRRSQGSRAEWCTVADRLFVDDSDDPAANDWNAYISLMLRGPAYVKHSDEPNGVWMDRVLLVKPQPDEAVDPVSWLTKTTMFGFGSIRFPRSIHQPRVDLPQPWAVAGERGLPQRRGV